MQGFMQSANQRFVPSGLLLFVVLEKEQNEERPIMNSLRMWKNLRDEALRRAKTLATFKDLFNFLFASNLHSDTVCIRPTPKLIIASGLPIIPVSLSVSQCRFASLSRSHLSLNSLWFFLCPPIFLPDLIASSWSPGGFW
jgi:hypothetical protein